MIAILDVHYTADTAYAAAIVLAEWQADRPSAEFTASDSPVADYEPGRFYRRELPPLRKLIATIDRPIETYVIDSYCYLSPDRTPGLGAYLFAGLSTPAAVVGVAKTRYRSAQAVEVLRASSLQPLFVTAIGISEQTAGELVRSMAGPYRIPDMIKAADRLARACHGP